MACTTELECLQSIEAHEESIDLQLQVAVPIATTTYVSISSGTWIDSLGTNGSAVWLLGAVLGILFIQGLRSARWSSY